MKYRLIPILCAIILLFQLLPAAHKVHAANGTEEDGISWSLSEDGTLTISGVGKIEQIHWREHDHSAVKLVIQPGITAIGTEIFLGLKKLQSVVLPEGLTEIGQGAFYNCTSLQSVVLPASLTHIGASAFTKCAALTDLTLPSGLEFIGSFAFSRCESLSAIQLPNSLHTIQDGAFAYCKSIQTISVPAGITVLNESVFANCTALNQVTLPNSVTEIKARAFEGCENLISVSMPAGLTTIGESAFGSCRSLSDMQLPDSVTTIGECAFKNCSNLQISIPKSATSIGSNAFDVCGSGRVLEIPEGLTELGVSPFPGCYQAQVFSVSEDNPNYASSQNGALMNKNMTELIQVPGGYYGLYEVPATVNTIRDGAFTNCGNITGVALPYGVSTIEKNAFKHCYSIEEIVIPASVKYLSEGTFYFCNGLTKITFCGDAPAAGEGEVWVFQDVENKEYDVEFVEVAKLTPLGKTTAYYPAGNPTWTAAAMEALGPDVTWIPYDELPEQYTPLTDAANPPEYSLQLISDHEVLSISTGDEITFGANVLNYGQPINDISGITFQVEDSTVLRSAYTKDANGFRYMSFRALKAGSTAIIVSDPTRGCALRIPITVRENHYHSYTLSSVPVQNIDRHPSNFYDVNGLYVDNYSYSIQPDKNAQVSFDVYNTNHFYGIVEVFKENGELCDSVLLGKRTRGHSGIKEVLGTNLITMYNDFAQDAAFSHRQQTGVSKLTSVSVTVPNGGYLRITTDPSSSDLLALVNQADIIMSYASLVSSGAGYVSSDFCQTFSKKLMKEQTLQFFKDKVQLSKTVWDSFGPGLVVTEANIGDLVRDFTATLDTLGLDGAEFWTNTAADVGCGWLEGMLQSAGKQAGWALGLIFIEGKTEDICFQISDLKRATGDGNICIQNQGGGIRASSQIQVKSDVDFPDDMALNTFVATLDSKILDELWYVNPDLHTAITKGTQYTFDISLMQNGTKAQHESAVKVYIPIPEDLKLPAYANKTKIYRVEDDGSLTQMDVKIEGGNFVFTTEHFSLYTMVFHQTAADQESQLQEQPAAEPNQVWILPAILVSALLAVAAAAIFLLRKKK